MKSGFEDFIVLRTSIANLHKWLTSMVGHSAFDGKLLYLEKLSLYNNLKAPVLFLFSVTRRKS